MVIDPNQLNPAGSASARNNRTSAPAASGSNSSKTGSSSPSAADQVRLSAEAQALARLEAKVNNLPEIDMDKVASIKAAIANGSFEINAERIAQRMLDADDLL